MEREELEDEVECFDCRAVINPLEPGIFIANDAAALCLACAMRRGGVYAGDDDQWTVEPEIADLPDDRRPHP